MITHKHRCQVILVIFMVLALQTLSACNFPGIADESTATPDGDALATYIAQTLVASEPEALPTLPGETPVDTATSPPVPADTATLTGPTDTLVPTLPPTATLSPTPAVPIISANVDTNCRMGPNADLYPVVGYLLVGQQSTVHGRDSSSNWWYIETPKKPGTYCWAWSGSTTVVGDTSNLPVITPSPPPPQPTPSISASFAKLNTCSGVPTAIFQITNTGSVAIESVSMTITDLTTNTVVYSQSSNSPFMSNKNSCPPGASSLAPGATAFVGGQLGIIPSGHLMQVTAQLCTKDNLGGACLVYNFQFNTP